LGLCGSKLCGRIQSGEEAAMQNSDHQEAGIWSVTSSGRDMRALSLAIIRVWLLKKFNLLYQCIGKAINLPAERSLESPDQNTMSKIQ
jgi:hypothetical protein